MNILIDRSSSIPLYIQIKERIKSLILKGQLKNGESLPTTRHLSKTLQIHRNTVITAYKALEDEGFAFSHVGRGTFVIEPDHLPQHNNIAYYNMFDWSHHITDKLKQRISHKLLTLYQSEDEKVHISFVWSQRGFKDFPMETCW